MKRILWTLGGGLGLLVVAAAVFLAWASGGHVPEGSERQVKTYDADPVTERRDTLGVMTYNVGYLSGMTNNRPVDPPRSLFETNMDRVESILREADPDFVGFQEIDFGADRSYGVQQLDSLASRLGYSTAAQATNWDKRYVPFPYWPPAVHFGKMHSGQAVMGRYPIEDHYSIELVRPPRPFYSDAFYLDRLAQVVVFNVDNFPLVVVNVHLEAFHEATREKQARQVRAIVLQHLAGGIPLLVIGDFNSVFPTHRPLLPPDEQVRFRGDETMAIATSPVALAPDFSEGAVLSGGLPGTFPADDPTRKIDYVFFNRERFARIDAEVHCGPPDAPPADHCAVSMEFLFPRPKSFDREDRRRYFDNLPAPDSVRSAASRVLEPAESADGG